jgi:hypothetical protein
MFKKCSGEHSSQRVSRKGAANLQNAVFVLPHNNFVGLRQDVQERSGASTAMGDIKMAANFADDGQDGIDAR